MHPIPTHEGMKKLRQVMCSNYGTCLDVAIERQWPGFDCRECSDFQPITWCNAEWTREAQACMRLLHEMIRLKG